MSLKLGILKCIDTTILKKYLSIQRIACFTLNKISHTSEMLMLFKQEAVPEPAKVK